MERGSVRSGWRSVNIGGGWTLPGSAPSDVSNGKTQPGFFPEPATSLLPLTDSIGGDQPNGSAPTPVGCLRGGKARREWSSARWEGLCHAAEDAGSSTRFDVASSWQKAIGKCWGNHELYRRGRDGCLPDHVTAVLLQGLPMVLHAPPPPMA